MIERWAGLAPAFPHGKWDVFPWTTNARLHSRRPRPRAQDLIYRRNRSAGRDAFGQLPFGYSIMTLSYAMVTVAYDPVRRLS